MRNWIIFFQMLVAVSLLAGCGGGSNQSGPVTSVPRQFQSLQFTLSATKATYALGEQVPITFTVTNVGTQSVTANIIANGADVQASQNSQVIWDALGTETNGLASQVVLAPGKSYSVPFPWTQMYTGGGTQVPAGQYTISGWFEPVSLNNGTILLPADAKSTLYASPIQITIQ